MDDIKVTTTLKKSIVLKANQLNKNIDANLLKVFKREYEGRCISEGFIICDKSKLLKRSVGYSRSTHFTGDLSFDAIFKVELYNPVKDNVIDCQIQRINELGIKSIIGPIHIVVPKELHTDKSLFKDLKVGDSIKVSVIARRFDLYDTVIYLTAKLEADISNIDIVDDIPKTITYSTDSDDLSISSDEEYYTSEGEEEKDSAIELADKKEEEEEESEEVESEEEEEEEDEAEDNEEAEDDDE